MACLPGPNRVLAPNCPLVMRQSLAVWVGLLALIPAFGAQIDLGRLTVTSLQGDPFRAVASLHALPRDRVSETCLFLGSASDMPEADHPILRDAVLKLNTARDEIEISTLEKISAPAVTVILRVQCAGAMPYVRIFTALIPPARKGAQTTVDGSPANAPGSHLRLLPGDTLESIAAVIYPRQLKLQQALVTQVIAGNRQAFPEGMNREVAAGTVLWIPDLRTLGKPAGRMPPVARTPIAAAVPGSTLAAAGAQAGSEIAGGTPAKRDTWDPRRHALSLDTMPGAAGCKALTGNCGEEARFGARRPAITGEKTRLLHTRITNLRLKQDSAEIQLMRVEQWVQQPGNASRPKAAPDNSATLPTPPVKTAPSVDPGARPRPLWLFVSGSILMVGVGFLVLRRRGWPPRRLAKSDQRLDHIPASATTVIREPESARPAVNPRIPAKTDPAFQATLRLSAAEFSPPPEAERTHENLAALQSLDPLGAITLYPPSKPKVASLSAPAVPETSQRPGDSDSNFAAVDQFIKLGNINSALSLLKHRIEKDPKNKNAWIRMLAVYRREKMNLEFEETMRGFKAIFQGSGSVAR